jgi:hypothetical protein
MQRLRKKKPVYPAFLSLKQSLEVVIAEFLNFSNAKCSNFLPV